MNYFWLFEVSACSVALPAIACALRWNRLGGKYLPLALLFLAGMINEAVSYYRITHHESNYANSNLYRLTECLLLLWFFAAQSSRKTLYRCVMAMAAGVWWYVNCLLHSIDDANGEYRILFSMLIVFAAVDRVNRLLLDTRQDDYRKTDLTIGLVLFVSFAYGALMEIFHEFPIGMPDAISIVFWLMIAVLNIISNIFFLLAIVWIPVHRQSASPY